MKIWPVTQENMKNGAGHLSTASGSLTGGRLIRSLAAILSGGLLVLAYPDSEISALAWFALVPLILACLTARVREGCILGWLTGAVALLGIHRWLFQIAGFGWPQALALELVYATFYLFWAAGLRWLTHCGWAVYPLAGYWVVLEWFRSHLGFMANPFATLAHSQANNTMLLQVASLTGEYGISYLLILTNLVFARSVLQRHLDRHGIVLVLLLLAAFGWGSLRLQIDQHAAPTFRVAVIQPSLSSADVTMPGGADRRLARLQLLTMSTIGRQPDLIVWPESALKNLHRDHSLQDHLHSLVRLLNRPIITGVSLFDYQPESTAVATAGNYNAGYIIAPERPVPPPYLKTILLPFGEYLPSRPRFPWPKWLVLDDFNMTPGTGPVRFLLPENIGCTVIICWENLFSDYVRQAVGSDVRLLVHLVNDFWFGATPASRQHNLASLFRAVENGVPIVVASNTGPSMVIDNRGRIRATLPHLFEKGALVAELSLVHTPTWYQRYGDWFAMLAAAVCIAGLTVQISLQLRVSSCNLNLTTIICRYFSDQLSKKRIR